MHAAGVLNEAYDASGAPCAIKKRMMKPQTPKVSEVGCHCCTDFVAQRGLLRELIEGQGHLMLERAVAHPELAGA